MDLHNKQTVIVSSYKLLREDVCMVCEGLKHWYSGAVFSTVGGLCLSAAFPPASPFIIGAAMNGVWYSIEHREDFDTSEYLKKTGTGLVTGFIFGGIFRFLPNLPAAIGSAVVADNVISNANDISSGKKSFNDVKKSVKESMTTYEGAKGALRKLASGAAFWSTIVYGGDFLSNKVGGWMSQIIDTEKSSKLAKAATTAIKKGISAPITSVAGKIAENVVEGEDARKGMTYWKVFKSSVNAAVKGAHKEATKPDDPPDGDGDGNAEEEPEEAEEEGGGDEPIVEEGFSDKTKVYRSKCQYYSKTQQKDALRTEMKQDEKSNAVNSEEEVKDANDSEIGLPDATEDSHDQKEGGRVKVMLDTDDYEVGGTYNEGKFMAVFKIKLVFEEGEETEIVNVRVGIKVESRGSKKKVMMTYAQVKVVSAFGREFELKDLVGVVTKDIWAIIVLLKKLEEKKEEKEVEEEVEGEDD